LLRFRPGRIQGELIEITARLHTVRRMRLKIRYCSAPALTGALLVVVGMLAACTSSPAAISAPSERVSGGPDGTYIVAAGIHKIKHVIIVMQ
jgi:hypothetical protein